MPLRKAALTATLYAAFAATAAWAAPRTLTLEAAINRALDANRGVVDAADGVESARYALAAVEAEYELRVEPRIGVDAAGGDSGEAVEGWSAGIAVRRRLSAGGELAVEPGLRRDEEGHRAGVDLRILQPLLRGRGAPARAPLEDARGALRSALRARQLREVAVVLETVGAAYAAVLGREVLRVTEESVARLREFAGIARVRQERGLGDPIDSYRAEIQLNLAEEGLAQAREALEDALDGLKLVLALPLDEELVVEAPLEFANVGIREDEALETALRSRLELEQAAELVRDAERHSRLAENRLLPALDLTLDLSGFGDGPELEDALSVDKASWGVGLASSATLGRRGEAAAHAQSVLAVGAARRSLELLRDEIARQVKRELRSLRRARERIDNQEEQIRQARGQLELARVKLRHGLAGNFEVIEAETALRRAQTDLVGAVVRYIESSWRLRAAMGTLVERPGEG